MQDSDFSPLANRTLTPKQEAFAADYSRHGNGARAYRTAYQAGTPSSVASERARRMLRRPNVRARVEELRCAEPRSADHLADPPVSEQQRSAAEPSRSSTQAVTLPHVPASSTTSTGRPSRPDPRRSADPLALAAIAFNDARPVRERALAAGELMAALGEVIAGIAEDGGHPLQSQH